MKAKILERVEEFLAHSVEKKKKKDGIMRKIQEDPSCRIVSEESDELKGIILFEDDPWASQLMTKQVGRISLFDVRKHLRDQGFRSIAMNLLNEFDRRVADRAYDMVSVRVSEGNIEIIQALENNGFRFVEVLLTLECSHGHADHNVGKHFIRPFQENDIDDLCDIAFCSFEYSRFHSDPVIDRSAANRSRVEWVRNACGGMADDVFLAIVQDQVVGFITCRVERSEGNRKDGFIDLVAVLPQFRGDKIGSSLVAHAQEYFATKVKSVYVGTQSKNIPALALYQKHGFYPVSSEATLHRHYS